MSGVWRAVPMACAVVLAGCFATRNDVRLLQTSLLERAQLDAARADSAHRAQVLTLTRQLTATSDSVRALSTFLARFALDVSRFQGDLATSMHSFGQQLIAVQEQMGQSKKGIADLRAELETRNSDLAASAIAPGAVPGATGASGPSTGPLQLLKAAWSQFDALRPAAARAGFEDFLRQFPNSDLAADAVFGLGRTYDDERMFASADSAYAVVTDKYPSSERAPLALYKRAMIASRGGPAQAGRAKSLFQQLLDKYPGSPEAELAKDKLKSPE